jgi:hypothetical protein
MARIQDGNSNAIFDEQQAIQLTMVALNSEASVELHGQAVAAVQVDSYTGSHVLAFEGTVDDANWRPLTAVASDDGTPESTVSGDGLWFVPVGGLRRFRVRVSSWTSGSSIVSIRAGYGGGTASYTPFGGAVSLGPGATVEVTLPPGSFDSFGHLIAVPQVNQIDVPFYRAAPGTLVTVTNTLGGAATAVSGGAEFASGANPGGGSKGVSLTSTVYSGGSEVYAYFTARFTPGVASSYQRIGLYDTNNGFFLGFNGIDFGITTRRATVDTFVAQASFSEDDLSGAPGSKFQRSGVPEGYDPEALNVFRIRFGWLGAAPVNFEVLSPDGRWVTFHKTEQPNLDTIPSIASADLPVTLDVQKTAAGATNLIVFTGCWAAGVTIETPGAIQGRAAHDAAASGNPVLMGARADTTEEVAVADGDAVRLLATLNAKLVVMPYAVPERSVDGITASMTGTGDTAVIAAPGAGLRLYITQILVTNGHATVGTYVNLKSAATSRYTGYARQAGGGFSLTFPTPLRLGVNEALNAANVTTGSDTRVSASGFIAP